MKQQLLHSRHNQSGIRFKSWSRKGYAVFCSLGRVVHIGNLSVSLVQWIGQLVEHVEAILINCMDLWADEADELQEKEEAALVPVMITVAETGASKKIVLKDINCRQ